jgi:hypothetical protein
MVTISAGSYGCEMRIMTKALKREVRFWKWGSSNMFMGVRLSDKQQKTPLRGRLNIV